jgi:hypothetical protein
MVARGLGGSGTGKSSHKRGKGCAEKTKKNVPHLWRYEHLDLRSWRPHAGLAYDALALRKETPRGSLHDKGQARRERRRLVAPGTMYRTLPRVRAEPKAFGHPW